MCDGHYTNYELQLYHSVQRANKLLKVWNETVVRMAFSITQMARRRIRDYRASIIPMKEVEDLGSSCRVDIVMLTVYTTLSKSHSS